MTSAFTRCPQDCAKPPPPGLPPLLSHSNSLPSQLQALGHLATWALLFPLHKCLSRSPRTTLRMPTQRGSGRSSQTRLVSTQLSPRTRQLSSTRLPSQFQESTVHLGLLSCLVRGESWVETRHVWLDLPLPRGLAILSVVQGLPLWHICRGNSKGRVARWPSTSNWLSSLVLWLSREGSFGWRKTGTAQSWGQLLRALVTHRSPGGVPREIMYLSTLTIDTRLSTDHLARNWFPLSFHLHWCASEWLAAAKLP